MEVRQAEMVRQTETPRQTEISQRAEMVRQAEISREAEVDDSVVQSVDPLGPVLKTKKNHPIDLIIGSPSAPVRTKIN